MKKVVLLTFLLIFPIIFLKAQNQPQPNPLLLKNYWDARWIAHPEAALHEYGVFHFRKSFTLPAKPGSFIINVSADNRYKLYVNGKFIGLGPAKSDLNHWIFDTYNIAPYLIVGKNTIAAIVWNFGEYKSYSQISNKSAFILQGNSDAEKIADTDKTWLVNHDEAYKPIVFAQNDKRLAHQYYVAGALDSLDAKKYPWDWQLSAFTDSGWLKPKLLNQGCPDGLTNPEKWTLTPRKIPFLEYTQERFKKVRKITGTEVDPFFLAQGTFWSLPANTKISLLVDNEILSTGYPELEVSGGAGSKIKITYAEALLNEKDVLKNKLVKYNRNHTDGNKIYGVYDIFLPDGGEKRTFQPLSMRTFRYVQLDIETGSTPLTIRDLSYFFSAYPVDQKSSFKTNDPLITKIWDISWRTSRLCANETYMDCPYYEQLQYIGDTRIMSLMSLYSSFDDRLVRNAIEQFNYSRSSEGLTMSRYPSDLPQYTPGYSLNWILMINDYWMHREDQKFIKPFIPQIISILDWYQNQINSEKMIGSLPYTDFIDSFYDKNSILKKSKSQSITPSTLFYVYTIEQIAPFLKAYGKTSEADNYLKIAQELKKSVADKCYNSVKKLFSDNSDKVIFSPHANIMAILTDATADKEQQKSIINTILKDTTLIKTTPYFKFYLFKAMKKAEVGNEYLNQLEDWKYMINMGQTTFSEWKTNPRSDCHGWSASPGYDFLATVCGIEPASPGFNTVTIKPNPGNLALIEGKLMHVKGDILVKYTQDGKGGLTAEVTLPAGLTGNFVYKGKTFALKSGKVSLVF